MKGFTFKKACEYLDNLSRLGIRMGLENIGRLMELLGHPERAFKAIHIGGTVGKGSTAHLVASILKEAGFKTGLFTSPHIYDVRERFRINGEMIGMREFTSLIWEIKNNIEVIGDFHPTQFEVHTALAFLWFAQRGCDFGVIEVGLGGRLDATNVLSPALTIITDIGIDHTDLLGSTIEEIAREKGGIIKEGVPLLTSAEGKALEVLRGICEERGARIFPLGGEIFWEEKDGLTVRSPWGEIRRIRSGLKGRHQKKNIALAVSAGLYLGCPEWAIREGVRKTRIKGRFEIVGRNPKIVLDGAHNPPSMKALREAIDKYFPKREIVLVMGMLRDKPIEDTMREIVPYARMVFITPPPSERSADLKDLVMIARQFNENVVGVEDNVEALKMAIDRAKEGDVVVVTGSFYLLGALGNIRRLLKN
ncbi:bifunctional folylpolyglutamate synthase/dihydrofolate synthase [bacterium]|nr:bifunctional folylpolyglutamate synthase/dihydrofolate synthase [bacterium]